MARLCAVNEEQADLNPLAGTLKLEATDRMFSSTDLRNSEIALLADH